MRMKGKRTLVIENGAPKDLEEREQKEREVYRFLEDCRIPFQRVDHDPVYTMEDCLEIDELLDAFIVKNLFLTNRRRTEFYLLILPEKKSFKSSVIAPQIGSGKLTFGRPEEMERLLEVTPGAVTVMGLMHDRDNRVKLLIDRDVLDHETIGCHPCVNTASIRIAVKDLLERFLPAAGHVPVIVKE